MKLAVRVKAGARRDGLWRDPGGLLAHIRAVPTGGQANNYLVKYLAGCLRVAPSHITIRRGHTSTHKLIEISIQESDLQPILDSLPLPPQAGLFDSPLD